MRESRNAYYATGHSCACPDDQMRNCRRRGGNSAYVAHPLCSAADITAEMISQYRERLARWTQTPTAAAVRELDERHDDEWAEVAAKTGAPRGARRKLMLAARVSAHGGAQRRIFRGEHIVRAASRV